MSDDIDGAFAELSRWLQHDAARVRRVVAAFHRVTVRELVDLEHAAARADWREVRRCADRIVTGCQHVGDPRAAECLVPLRDAEFDFGLRAQYFAWYAPRRHALLRALERAATLVMGDVPG